MKINIQQLLLLMGLFISLQANSQSFNMVWSDEFNGTGAVDPTKWGNEVGYVRNNELQYYTTSTNNARQNGGNLEITVRKEPMNGYNYTSASLITLRKNDWIYGKIEGKFKIPKGKGLWACFWTLGANYEQVWWPQCGEIDIFEHINSESMVHGTTHWADASNAHVGKGSDSPLIDVTQWHTYSIVWTPKSIKWLVDDVQFREFDITNGINSTQEFHKPHYILVNLPIGGSWPGSPDATTVLPATMYCDYIRVFELVPEGSQTGNQFINCGGDNKDSFVSDKWYSNGATYSYNTAANVGGVVNAAPAEVYQSNRSGNLSYTISGLKPDSTYTTRLHFAENSLNKAGARSFNVKINGIQLLTGFDIFVMAGNLANKAVVKDFTAIADGSGKIVIQLISVVNNAQINGIGVFPNSGVQVPMTDLTLPATMSLTSIGESSSMPVTISPNNTSNQKLDWTSSNTAVATVSGIGMVTAVANGTATISASSTDGSKKAASCIVTVNSNLVSNEIIVNGDFSQGKANWGSLWFNSPGLNTATATVTDGVYVLDVTQPSNTNWHIVTQQGGFTLSQGVKYTVSMDAWADNPNGLDIYLAKNYGDYGNYFGEYGKNVSATKQRISFTVTMNQATDNNCRIVIGFGAFTGKLYLDNISILKSSPVNNISLPATAIINTLGLHDALKATLLPADATNKGIEWSSSNTAIATVSETGEITAIANGTTIITATSTEDNKIFGTCTLTINTDFVFIHVLTLPGTIELKTIGETSALTATFAPENASIKTVTWSSSNPSVATISNTGLVTAQSNGTATITCTSTDGSNNSGSCTVTVNAFIPVTGVSLTGNLTLSSIGSSVLLKATVSPAEATNPALSWTSSNEKVVTVSPLGLVKAIGPGNALVTVTTVDGSKQATCEIAVLTANAAVYEAENGTRNGSAVVKDVPNASNGKVVSDFTAINSFSKVINVDGGLGGKAVLTIRYANGNPVDGELTLHVSGIAQHKVFFPPTGNWNTFSEVSMDITLVAGMGNTNTNAIKLQRVDYYPNSADAGGIDVDRFTVTTAENTTLLVTGVSLPATATIAQPGGTFALTATVSPANANNKVLAWTSSNPTVATVSSAGLVTAVKSGTASITATSTDGSYQSAACNLTVNATILITQISLPPSITFTTIGQINQLMATITPPNATNTVIAWSSSNVAVATVSNTGAVTAISDGKVLITATAQDGSKQQASSEITVSSFVNVQPKLANEKTSVSVYPNPAIDQFSIDFNGFGENNPVGINIYSITGKLIYQKNTPGGQSITLHFENLLKSGVYVVKVQSNREVITRKLVINAR